MKNNKFLKICAISIIAILVSCLFLSLKTYAEDETTLVFSDSEITEQVAGTGYKISGTTLTIQEAGTYRISGSCEEGSIEVKKGITGVILILDNLTLSSSTTAPIVIKKDGTSVTIRLVGTSTISDKENPENENSTDTTVADAFEGAAIKVKSASSLIIEGDGTLNIDGSTCKNGIKGGATSSITINSGSLNVYAANTGIACDGALTINKGTIEVQSNGDGIKSEPDADDKESAGTVTINGGSIKVEAQEDGIQAANKLYITNGNFNIKTANGYTSSKYTGETSCKGLKASTNEQENVESEIEITGGIFDLNTADDSIHSDAHVKITGGTFNIYTGDDGVHADTSLILGTNNGLERDPEITINHCYEGLEAGTVYAYSGKYYLIATDDAINAAGGTSSGDNFKPGGRPGQQSQGNSNYNLYIYGGDFYVEVASGDHDGLDSNGGLYLLGGNITINGGTAPLDSDGTMKINGATVFVAGSDNMGDISLSSDSQGYIAQGLRNSGSSGSSVQAGRVVNVYDASNNIVYSQKLKVNSSVLLYSSPNTTSSYSFNTSASSVDTCKSDSWKHSWDNGVVTTEPTETSNGIKTYTCTLCGKTERKTVLYSESNSNPIVVNKGDVNGDGKINISDVLKLRRHIANQTRQVKKEAWELTEEQQEIADINGDGKINISDVLKLRRYIAASINEGIAQKHPEWLELE